MTKEALSEFTGTLAPDLAPGTSVQYAEFVVPAERLHELCLRLKEADETMMDYLFCLTAADRRDGFHVIYHMTSSERQHTLKLRVVLPDKENPAVDTVSDIWKAAGYYEREVFDLFGIRFNHHPDMRRLFLDDDWVGFPLRKDYKDEFTLTQ